MSRNEESFILKYLKHEGNVIRRFLSSKDLLIFLFFLIVSTGLWTLHALRKEYETIITIPITYEKAPKWLIEQSGLKKELKVTVSDNGTNLVRYRWMHTFNPISIDISRYTDGKVSLNTSSLERQIQIQLNNSTKIIRTSPEKIELNLENITKKEVPITFNGVVTFAPQYMRKGDIKLEPKTVTIFGSKNELDAINEVHTKYVKLDNVKGSKTLIATLSGNDKISFSQDSIICTQYSERFTEKTIEVPIHPILDSKKNNLGKKLRTFPVTAKVKFHIGLSNYDQIRAEDLKVTANYSEMTNSRIQLRLEVNQDKEDLIEAKEIIPASVECLLEGNE